MKLNAPPRTVRTEFPREVRTVEHAWIPLRDGCRLAARIWLPVDAEQRPVPAILEYIPYRKNDGTILSDVLRHPYFAGHGYAALRVDLRGTGDSDGLIYDEYLEQELEDALDVLAWLEQQPWCTGAVGMMGYSWGGFNALQVAALRPRQLKAIVTVHSADDRYAGDCHYIGGNVLAYDMLSWGITAFAYNLRPPDPAVLGDEWRARWRERLEAAEPYVHAWLTHQLYDDYWKHGSVCEDYRAIECAVLTVGGWADPYHDTVSRLLANLTAPRRGLIGPWAHQYPDEASPGPQIGFNQECLRWWDQWLKGIETGVMSEPLLRAYVLDAEEPATAYEQRAGHWVGVERARAGRSRRLRPDAALRRPHARYPSPRAATRPSACGEWRLRASPRARGARTPARRRCPATSAATTPWRWRSTPRRWTSRSRSWAFPPSTSRWPPTGPTRSWRCACAT